MSNAVERWLNRYQLLVGQAKPRVAIIEAGRRGGKTEEILAERTLLPMYKMPGCSGFIAGKSFSKLLDHMLPGLIAGWAKRGFIEGEDYVIGRKPPKGWKSPLMPPKKWDHYIPTKWGSGMHLISFDHSYTSNALSTDFGAIDEGKQMDPVRVKTELLKTMSGHRSIRLNSNTVWGDLPEHLMLTILSDKYIGKYDYKWLDDFKKDAMPMNDLYKLAALAQRVQDGGNKYLERALWELQRNALAYIAYSSRESLPIIGIDYYKMQSKNSTAIEFQTSIMNEDVLQVEGGFYIYLDQASHCYEARDYARIDAIGIGDYLKGKERNCRLDRDLRAGLPIKVGVDYGSHYSWFTVAQKYADTYWLQNNIYTVPGEHFLNGVDRFCNYYAPHDHKVVELYDDPSGHKTTTDQQKDVDKVIARLKQRGWMVKHMNPKNNYISHHNKYRIWEMVLNEGANRNPKAPKFRVNTSNAYEAYYSMSQARIKSTKNNEYGKDKDDEGKMGKEEWKATHLSDSVDNIVCFDNQHLLEDKSKWVPW